MRLSGNAALDAKALAALRAFDAPLGFVWAYSPDKRLSSVAALSHGVVALGGEFGGGGRVSPSGVRLVERGVYRLLRHVGVLETHAPGSEEPEAAGLSGAVRMAGDRRSQPGDTRSGELGDRAQGRRLVELKGRDYYVYSPEDGLFEPFCELGDEVQAGQACGQVHFVDNPGRPAEVCHFRTAGMVVCKRHPGRVVRGDCVAHLATDYAGAPEGPTALHPL